MYARVVSVKIKPGKLDRTIETYNNSVIPAANEQKGFEGSYLLTDWNNSKGMSISFWETKADMHAGEASGYYQEQISKFAEFFAEPPTSSHYEVTVKEQPR